MEIGKQKLKNKDLSQNLKKGKDRPILAPQSLEEKKRADPRTRFICRER
jgi:hypothetical protein